MLKKLSDQVAECYRHADKCRRKAEESKISTAKKEFLEMERRWILLARSYELSERLTDFTAFARKQKTRRP